MTGAMRPTLAAMAPDQVAQVKARVRARLKAETGPVRYLARANAIKGRVPGP